MFENLLVFFTSKTLETSYVSVFLIDFFSFCFKFTLLMLIYILFFATYHILKDKKKQKILGIESLSSSGLWLTNLE
jgi:predicted neutral ceramidase superfamily lipid hydrolase